MPTTTTTTDRAARLADSWRKHADMLSGCGAEIAALSYLRSYTSDPTASDAERGAALTDALAALDILDRERAAQREG